MQNQVKFDDCDKNVLETAGFRARFADWSRYGNKVLTDKRW